MYMPWHMFYKKVIKAPGIRTPTLLGEPSDVSNPMIQPAGIREVSITVEPPAYTCPQNTSGRVSYF